MIISKTFCHILRRLGSFNKEVFNKIKTFLTCKEGGKKNHEEGQEQSLHFSRIKMASVQCLPLSAYWLSVTSILITLYLFNPWRNEEVPERGTRKSQFRNGRKSHDVFYHHSNKASSSVFNNQVCYFFEKHDGSHSQVVEFDHFSNNSRVLLLKSIDIFHFMFL